MSSAEDNLDRVFGSDSDSLQSGPEITEPKDEFGIFEDDTENNQAEETPRTSGGDEEPHISRTSSRKRTLADVKVKEMSVRRLWAPRDTGRTPMLLKMPGFLGIQHGPYDPDSVLEEELGAFDGRLRDGDAETAALLLRSAVSIRWRVDPDTSEMKPNSRLVKWSDGSWSLMVGEELFEVSLQSMAAEQNFIYGRHVEEGSMECLGKLRDRLMIRPYITDNQGHRKYLAAAATASSVGASDVRVKMAVTTADPEKEKQRMIKLEQEKIKERRKMEAKRRNLKQRSFERVSRTGLTARFLEEKDQDDGEFDGEAGEDQDAYEDDFIDDTMMEDGDEDQGHEEDDDSEEAAESNVEESEAEFSDAGASEGELEPNAGKLKKQPRRSAIIDDDDDE